MRIGIGIMFAIGGIFLAYLVLSGKFPNPDAQLVNPAPQQHHGQGGTSSQSTEGSGVASLMASIPFMHHSAGMVASRGL